jgi:hypothetical protein
MLGDLPSDAELLDAALCAYRLKLSDIQALLSWATTCD